MKSCAFFDIDGTLLNGFIIQSFPRYLADNGIIESRYSDKIDKIVGRYDANLISYREAALTIPQLVAISIRGRGEKEIRQQAKEFMKEYVPHTILGFAEDLINEVKGRVDLNIALSGSPIEAVKELHGLGFDFEYGTLFEVENSMYTGKIEANLILGEVKAEHVMKIVESHDVDLERTVAFGDSDQDVRTLELVGLPIALNPSEAMKEICMMRGWRLYNKETMDVEEIIDLIKQLMRLC